MTIEDRNNRSEEQNLSQDPSNSAANARLLEETQIQEARQLLDWGKNNFGRFDLGGDRRLNASELRTGIRTADNEVDRHMLSQMADKYDQLKRQNSGVFGHKDSISVADLEKNVKIAEENARKAEEARQAQARLEGLQATSRELMGPLMATASGNAQQSLFKVLDDNKGGRPDDKVSKSDLERFVREYDRRTAHGDVGRGVYTEDNRYYVQGLIDNWNSDEVIRLRGTYKSASDDRDIPNGTISLDSLRKAGGFYSGASVYEAYNRGEAEAHSEGTVSGERISYMRQVPLVAESEDSVVARRQGLEHVQMVNDARNWASTNYNRVDLTGDRKWTYGEVDTNHRIAEEPADKQPLSYYLSNFGKISRNNSTRIDMNDIHRHANTEAEMFQQAEAARRAELAARQAQADAQELMRPLLATQNGQAQESLFGVIDGLRGGVDDKIGKGDLERYLREFDRRARHNDIGAGHFTMPERQYVQYLVDNWNNNDVVALRGTFWSEQQQRHIPNRNITLNSLREAGALSNNDPFRHYRADASQR